MSEVRNYDCSTCRHDNSNPDDLNNYCVKCTKEKKNGIPSEWALTDNTIPYSKFVDNVNHPQHYKSETGLETIDVIEAFCSDLKGIEATDTGNIIKYICRWKHKNGIEDLKKAQWYLNHLISKVEKRNEFFNYDAADQMPSKNKKETK